MTDLLVPAELRGKDQAEGDCAASGGEAPQGGRGTGVLLAGP